MGYIYDLRCHGRAMKYITENYAMHIKAVKYMSKFNIMKFKSYKLIRSMRSIYIVCLSTARLL